MKSNIAKCLLQYYSFLNNAAIASWMFLILSFANTHMPSQYCWSRFFPRLSISNSYNELLELRWGKDAILRRRPHNNLEELRSRTGDFLIVKRCLGVKKDGHGTNCGTDACPHRYTAVRRSMNKSMLKQNGESSCGGGPLYIPNMHSPPLLKCSVDQLQWLFLAVQRFSLLGLPCVCVSFLVLHNTIQREFVCQHLNAKSKSNMTPWILTVSDLMPMSFSTIKSMCSDSVRWQILITNQFLLLRW